MLDEYLPKLMKETVTVEKKVFDTLQKNNRDLMDMLEKAKEALRFYADINNYDDVPFIQVEDKGHCAREILKELEND